MIRISNCEDRESSTERTITITGATESVALAQYLINTRSVDWNLVFIPKTINRKIYDYNGHYDYF